MNLRTKTLYVTSLSRFHVRMYECPEEEDDCARMLADVNRQMHDLNEVLHQTHELRLKMLVRRFCVALLVVVYPSYQERSGYYECTNPESFRRRQHLT